MGSSKKFILALAILITLVGGVLGVYLLMKPKTDSQNFAPNQTITIRGKVVCLPHKDQDGPQTLECATGLLADAGAYYALEHMPPGYSGTGAAVEVTGPFQEPEADNIYDIAGIINVVEVKQF